MGLQISLSSLRVRAIVSQRCKAPFNEKKLVPIKPTATTDAKSSYFPSNCSANELILPVGLYGESRFSKSLLSSQSDKRNSIRACARVESDDFDPILAKTQVKPARRVSIVDKVWRFGSSWFKFIRPYAMLQSIISTVCLFARVLAENPQFFKRSVLLKAFPGLIAVVLAFAYANGINQIFDVDIDRSTSYFVKNLNNKSFLNTDLLDSYSPSQLLVKSFLFAFEVNKPYLAIPAGKVSLNEAWLLMIFDVLVGLIIFQLMKADLITTSLYCLGLLLSTFYSAPPFRFKGSSVATVILIPLVCGIIQNVGILYATRASLGLPFWWSPPIVFITTVVTLHFAAMSIVKDITDVEGDMKHNIVTFAARFGLRNIVFFGTGLLLMNYIGAIVAAIYMPQAFKRYLMLPAHSIFTLLLLLQARKLDKANYDKEACANFYQFLWKLLGLEFLLFPFI